MLISLSSTVNRKHTVVPHLALREAGLDLGLFSIWKQEDSGFLLPQPWEDVAVVLGLLWLLCCIDVFILLTRLEMCCF